MITLRFCRALPGTPLDRARALPTLAHDTGAVTCRRGSHPPPVGREGDELIHGKCHGQYHTPSLHPRLPSGPTAGCRRILGRMATGRAGIPFMGTDATYDHGGLV
jgi:hypothetical protein